MKAETLSIAGGMSEHETKQWRRPDIKRKARDRDEAKSKTRTGVTSDWTKQCSSRGTISRTSNVAVEAVRRTTKTYNTHARSTRRNPVPQTTWPGLYLHNIALKLNFTLRSNQPISYMQA